MATEKEMNELLLENVDKDKVRTRKMMGEYIIYYEDVVIGGLYDNRLLVKATKSALEELHSNPLASPYPKAKKMILVPDFTQHGNLTELFKTIKKELKK
ncbi:TfoX/Sxy family protein [Staphylococcus caledonicus]|uniref:TfoX/Sxy family protein n=1 Tax=Staphylococcus caledonicus TaxID=2741333 RepID=UPI0018E423D3|nr:TfoX/Sxy family protein [Staphylococcus caledonicus]MBI5973633.1 TfoX/Sxy family protein [Staphylococcus caledonicus]